MERISPGAGASHDARRPSREVNRGCCWAIAFCGAASGIYVSIADTPLFWLVPLAPLGLVMFLSFRIDNMSRGEAQISFWLYAALVGFSLSGIFLIYTGESIARVFVISAATYGATSIYGY
ncbi:Bax inhibitor-1 family protein, partial [Caballeronia sp. BR00000012568055]|uniref:Bax inhibitor-1 family protein n=1 Tax=Caballeronia sp. BR00000012568055 TaxID=2918761 RepID=UPI0023F91379